MAPSRKDGRTQEITIVCTVSHLRTMAHNRQVRDPGTTDSPSGVMLPCPLHVSHLGFYHPKAAQFRLNCKISDFQSSAVVWETSLRLTLKNYIQNANEIAGTN